MSQFAQWVTEPNLRDLWLVGSLANWLVAIIAQKFLCGAASLTTRQNFKGM